jgi:MFS family permease
MKNNTKRPAKRTLQGLDWLNFLLADVQAGVGPFLAIYLAKYGWNEELVGTALAVGGIAGIIAQTPAGALVDGARSKRALVAAGIIALAVGALVIAVIPRVWPVLLAQVLIGASSSIFIPAICAISLGVVGHRLFDRRQGRNQTFNSAGNVMAAVSMGLLAYYVSDRAIFFFVMALAIPTLWALGRIRADDIDYELARGASTQGLQEHVAHVMFMSACVVTTQFIITLLASWAGVKAGDWGRKPLPLIGFAVLPVRGILYTLTGSAPLLIGIQVLDGIGAITTAVGIGAALSQAIAGGLVHHYGSHVGFLFLAGVASAALATQAAQAPK